MTRLIDADKLNIYDVSPAYGMCVMGVTEEDIDEAPTVDAVPVVHGRWELVKLWTGFETLYCSECNYETNIGSNYCPACGARMDAERKEE